MIASARRGVEDQKGGFKRQVGTAKQWNRRPATMSGNGNAQAGELRFQREDA